MTWTLALLIATLIIAMTLVALAAAMVGHPNRTLPKRPVPLPAKRPAQHSKTSMGETTRRIAVSRADVRATQAFPRPRNVRSTETTERSQARNLGNW
jgi:hypothetical protein